MSVKHSNEQKKVSINNSNNFQGENVKIPVLNVENQSPKISSHKYRDTTKSASTKYTISNRLINSALPLRKINGLNLNKDNTEKKIKIKKVTTEGSKNLTKKEKMFTKNFKIKSKDKINDFFSKANLQLTIWEHIFSQMRINLSKENAKRRENEKKQIKFNTKNYIDASLSSKGMNREKSANDIYKPVNLNNYLSLINDANEYKNNLLKIKDSQIRKYYYTNSEKNGELENKLDVKKCEELNKKEDNGTVIKKNDIYKNHDIFNVKNECNSKSTSNILLKKTSNEESNSYWTPKANLPLSVTNFNSTQYSLLSPNIKNYCGMTINNFFQHNKGNTNITNKEKNNVNLVPNVVSNVTTNKRVQNEDGFRKTFYKSQSMSEFINLNNPFTVKANSQFLEMYNNDKNCFRRKKVIY